MGGRAPPAARTPAPARRNRTPAAAARPPGESAPASPGSGAAPPGPQRCPRPPRSPAARWRAAPPAAALRSAPRPPASPRTAAAGWRRGRWSRRRRRWEGLAPQPPAVRPSGRGGGVSGAGLRRSGRASQGGRLKTESTPSALVRASRVCDARPTGSPRAQVQLVARKPGSSAGTEAGVLEVKVFGV